LPRHLRVGEVRVLVLGGTVFVGRHVVEAALRSGHEVTLFNRGRSRPGLWPDVTELHGDRDGDLAPLRGGSWDVAVDISGYVPHVVALSAELLAERTDHYTFVSSVSVYPEHSSPPIDETSPTSSLPEGATEEVTESTYGPLKVLCEQAVFEAMPGRALAVRPGLVAGPHDPTDRFTYWPRRVAEGGIVLAPGRPQRTVQLIDARDLGEWIVAAAEARLTGIFNATGPAQPLTMGELLERCNAVGGHVARFEWIADHQLLQAGVEPWSEMPLWIPESHPESALEKVDSSKARARGLQSRRLEETIADTLEWDRERPSSERGRAGLSPARERELLERFGVSRGHP
jgi:2'-hydroxyisoflavone reductase